MLGAIAGDICGSVYERRKYTGGEWDMPLFTDKSHFTDDTVMTIACMDALQAIDKGEDAYTAFRNNFLKYGRLYPDAGYGRQFREWLASDNPAPYGSFGNGAAMRVSPIGWKCDNLERINELARASANVSHNHPEGIKAAQAVASAVFLARTGADKESIRNYISDTYNYNLKRTLREIGKNYRWSSHSQTSVPEAIIAFLDSSDYESAIRGAIWLGGDADTQAAIAGGIASAFYGKIPDFIISGTRKRLDNRLNAKVDEWLASFK